MNATKIQPFFKIFTLLVVLAYFSLQFMNIFAFSDSFEEISMRNIDDAAMQGAIAEWHQAIFRMDLSQVFFKFDYAYGWIFWATYGVMSLPAAVLLKIYPDVQIFERAIIISNRFTTFVISILVILAIRKFSGKILQGVRFKQKENSDNSKIIINFLTILVLMVPSLGYWMGRVQPNMLTLLLLTLGLNLIIEVITKAPLNLSSSRLLQLGIMCVSASVASKPVTIYWLPIILLIAIRYLRLHPTKNQIHLKSSFLLKTCIFQLVSILVFLSPYLLVSPWTTVTKLLSIFKYFSNTTTDFYTNPALIVSRFNNGFMDPLLGQIGFLFLLTLVLLNFFKTKKTGIFYLYIYLVSIGLLFSVVGPTYPQLIASYTFPLLLFVIVILVLALSSEKSNATNVVASILLLISMIFNFIVQLDSDGKSRNLAINTYLIDSRSAENALKKMDISKIRENVQLDVDPIIVQSYRTPTVHSSMYSPTRVIYIFDNWETLANLSDADWVVLPRIEFLKNPFFRNNDKKIEDVKNFDKLSVGSKFNFGKFACQIAYFTDYTIIMRC